MGLNSGGELGHKVVSIQEGNVNLDVVVGPDKESALGLEVNQALGAKVLSGLNEFVDQSTLLAGPSLVLTHANQAAPDIIPKIGDLVGGRGT